MLSLKRPGLRRLHAISGILAILIVSSFLAATLIAEFDGDPAFIATVKQAIAYGLVVLVPTMAAIGLSGTRLAGTSKTPIIKRKRRHMSLIAANGLLILLPCALILAWLATTGEPDITFYLVQGIEIIAGSVNITLLILSARLGMSMRSRSKLPRTSEQR
jgi:hypothetical protein